MRNAVSTRRYRFRRAIERGDPRLGMIVGVVLAALSAGVFVRRDLVPPAERLEQLALDVGFRHRTPIRESDKIVLVDIDDTSTRRFRWPMDRKYYAQALLALDRLGARQVAFDIEFKIIAPTKEDFDVGTGEYRLKEDDRALRFAIARSGKVTLAYHVEAQGRLAPELAPYLPKLREVFAKNPAAEEDEVARGTGAPAPLVRANLERLREQVTALLVADLLEKRSDLSFPDLRKALLPQFSAHRNGREVGVLQAAYHQWKAVRALQAKSVPVRAEPGPPPRLTQWRGIVPPLPTFLDPARGFGCASSEPDGDGVMRRPWPLLAVGGRYYPYLGLQVAMQEMETAEERVEAVLHPDSVEIVRFGRADGTRRGEVRLPLDAEGRLLANWAGNGRRNRRGQEGYFSHVPFAKAVEFYQTRYEDLDKNVRTVIDGLSEDQRKELDAEKYLRNSDRYLKLLKGEIEAPLEEVRTLEERIDKYRENMVREFRAYLAGIDERLKGITSPRIRENSLKERAKWADVVARLTEADEAEKKLRPLVEGKICLIGSADTASGDLHATPLGPSTPGVDVHANVANMALTGQVLRVVPNWANFLILFATGLLVSFYVTHWQTFGSAIATGATIAASGGLFWALFTGPAILVPGAGPVVTAVLTFAGVTAYKELLTQRSKRKLQRELEKNTSAELVKILLEHPEFLSEPRRMTGTFFFSDVKSFTSITEKMDAEVLFPFINRYLDRVTQELRTHQAFVDKYIGDGIMALFGIPVPTPDHARLGCKAALDCQAALKPLNAEFKLEGLPEVKMRIGIHSGEVRAGNVGSLERSNYTVLGDNVNLAARLEGANKEYETSVMISEATWELVSGKFVARELDTIRVVGKRKPVKIFELLAPVGDPVPMEPAFLEAYAAALALFKDRRWAESIAAFENCLGMKPGDKPCRIYVERATLFRETPPPPDWEGVFELTSK